MPLVELFALDTFEARDQRALEVENANGDGEGEDGEDDGDGWDAETLDEIPEELEIELGLRGEDEAVEAGEAGEVEGGEVDEEGEDGDVGDVD